MPQISAPYIKIGKTILSKRSRARVIGIPPQVLIVFLIIKIALSACDTNVCKATVQQILVKCDTQYCFTSIKYMLVMSNRTSVPKYNYIGFRHIDLQTIFVAECTQNVNTILKWSDSIIH